MDWFQENSISFLGSIPCPSFQFRNISEMDGFKGTYLSRLLAQTLMLFNYLGAEGGVSMIIGKKLK